jgi:glycosyltransferase involved in cell wall biosynthesis
VTTTERRLRILAVLQGGAKGGGGSHQSVSALITLTRIAESRFDVEFLDLGGSHREAIARAVADGRMPALPEVPGPDGPTGMRRWMKRSRSFPARAARTLLQAGDLKDDLAAFLDAQPVDLLYFLHPSELAGRIAHRNILTTVWDLCHRDFPEFPEVRTGGEFQSRERILNSHVTRAVGVIVDSEASAQRMHRSYGVDPERILVMPFSPSSALESPQAQSTEVVLSRYGLSAGYLLYPAQFWPHKNHVRLLEAIALRRSGGYEDRLVFAGADKGNREHVLERAAQLGVADLVTTTGYVDDLELRGLYDGCRALVMPTYFGPTNLPPLEAWTMGRPLVYPQHLAAQVGDAAVLFDVDDAHSLADALGALDDVTTARRLVSAGARMIEVLRQDQADAAALLTATLEKFDRRRSIFPAGGAPRT